MHWYKRNIGDYAKKAGRLSMLQHGAYTLLMDAIYDREKFPTMEDAIDWLWASSKEETEAIEFVLNRFFYLDDGRYVQARMAEEIQHYTGNRMSNSVNGAKGGRPKGSKNKPKETEPVNLKTEPVNLKTESNRTESELKPKPVTKNQELRTKNQEPATKNQSELGETPKPPKLDFSKLGLSDDLISEVRRIRKKNKGGVWSQRSINGIAKELKNAAGLGLSVDDVLTEWDLAGWKSFKADWVAKRLNTESGGGRLTLIEQQQKVAAQMNAVTAEFLNEGTQFVSYNGGQTIEGEIDSEVGF